MVDQLQWFAVAAGETLDRRGDDADGAGFLASGRRRAIRGEGATAQVLGEVGAGEAVGEMALLGSDRRTATVAAVGTRSSPAPGAAAARLSDEADPPSA